ncbi:MAG: hypothetical protein ACYC3N_11825 [Halothiobacillus sp.]
MVEGVDAELAIGVGVGVVAGEGVGADDAVAAGDGTAAGAVGEVAVARVAAGFATDVGVDVLGVDVLGVGGGLSKKLSFKIFSTDEKKLP